MRKRFLVYILTALMVVSLLPLTALADGAYTVTYDANGAESGTVPVDSAAYNSGASVTASANTGLLAKTGYTFAGWNTASDGSGTACAENASMTMPDGNVVFYAQWTAIPCSVKFDSQGGTAVADWMGKYGDIITTAPVTTYEGRDFFGWYTDLSYSTQVTFPFTVNANVTLYAKWEPKSAYLSNVAVSVGTLSKAFSKTVYSYKIQLPETENSVTITPTLENGNAKLQMWTNRVHTAVTSSGLTVNVENNKTVTAKIKVTYKSADGTSDIAHVYTFVIKRDKSTDAALKSLTASAGTLSPSFNPTVQKYTLNIDSSVKSVTLSSTANSQYAKVRHFIKVNLKAGQTKTVIISVKPQTGRAMFYTVTITRAKSTITDTGANNTPGKGSGGSGNNGNSGNNGGGKDNGDHGNGGKGKK